VPESVLEHNVDKTVQYIETEEDVSIPGKDVSIHDDS